MTFKYAYSDAYVREASNEDLLLSPGEDGLPMSTRYLTIHT